MLKRLLAPLFLAVVVIASAAALTRSQLPSPASMPAGSEFFVDDAYSGQAGWVVNTGGEWRAYAWASEWGFTFMRQPSAAAALSSLGVTSPPASVRAKLTTATDGTVTWTYATPFASGVVPVITATVQSASGSTDLLNVQLDGAPTNTQAKFRVNRTAPTSVALLGLTILALPASVGAQTIHAEATAP